MSFQYTPDERIHCSTKSLTNQQTKFIVQDKGNELVASRWCTVVCLSFTRRPLLGKGRPNIHLHLIIDLSIEELNRENVCPMNNSIFPFHFSLTSELIWTIFSFFFLLERNTLNKQHFYLKILVECQFAGALLSAYFNKQIKWLSVVQCSLLCLLMPGQGQIFLRFVQCVNERRTSISTINSICVLLNASI